MRFHPTNANDDLQANSDSPQVDLAQRKQAAARSTWISVGINLVLALVQIAAGIWSRSQGLVADGLHSLSDLVADFLVLLANRHSHLPADAEHPYGHHRFETAASVGLGLLLIGVGAGMLWAAVTKLQSPELVQPVHAAALWVVGIALVAKEALFRYLLAVARRVRSGMLIANAWHARSDAASSLVVGLGIIGNLSGYPLLDPVAALVVGGMVARMGWKFGWNALHDLMDRAVEADEVEAIRATLASTPGVSGVHDLRTRIMGDMVAADAHLEIDGQITVAAGHAIAVEARQRVLNQHRVTSLTLHVDPWEPPAGQTAAPSASHQ